MCTLCIGLIFIQNLLFSHFSYREEFLRALQKQTVLYELANDAEERAKLQMDLILLSLYITMPPGRALEIRTLEVFVETEESRFDIRKEGNYIVLRLSGDVLLQYFSHKTSKKFGRDMMIIEVKLKLSNKL